MAPQSRGPPPSFSTDIPIANFSALQGFNLAPENTAEETTPRALNGLNHPSLSSTSADGDVDEEDEDAEFQLDDSQDVSSSSGSSESGSDHGDELGEKRPFFHHSNSSFAPPFYNRPPTPLPPSPSLTSLLRPSFSTSRPTTPDSSENDTPNDTEAAVAKSARTATRVPRASPKVPTYEYYGFVLYLLSSLVFRM